MQTGRLWRSPDRVGYSLFASGWERTQRNPTPGAIYTTLDRLEDKGLLKSSIGEATPERGGRAKRYYAVTSNGLKALRRAHADYRKLSQGLDIFGESYA